MQILFGLEAIPANLIALMAVGMAIAFLAADPRNRSSRWFATALVAIGGGVFCSATLLDHGDWPALIPLWSALGGLFDAVALYAGCAWAASIRKTIPAGSLDTRGGDWMLRIGQVCAVVYALLSVFAAEWRTRYFLEGITGDSAMPGLPFLLFAVPLEIGIGLLFFAVIITLNRKPERSEAVRLLAFAVGAPIIASGLVISDQYAGYTGMIGLLIILIGAVRYHVLEGRKGAFMQRFLAPEVAKLVRARGMRNQLANDTREISVVSVDIRGYTAFAEEQDSAVVIDGLRDYYALVGETAARHNATIKDYAGDGVLLLVGAPLPVANHAQCAAALARDLVDSIGVLVSDWCDACSPLGVGAGVATGVASVGVVGGTRLEYAAVGSVVNRAARLCDQAADTEVLIDQATRDGLGAAAADACAPEARPLTLKGFAEPVPAYAVCPPSAGAPLPSGAALA